MIDTKAPAKDLRGENGQLFSVDETLLIDRLTNQLIEAISLLELADIAGESTSGNYAGVQDNKVLGSKRIEMIFAQVRDFIERNELPPRFLAALDKSYHVSTGRSLKVDLGANASEFDRSFQLAIDIASHQSANSTFNS